MTSRVLITTDLHFSDRANAEYRWDVLEHLTDAMQKHDATDLFILGDLTDEKDHHSAALVHRMIEGFNYLRDTRYSETPQEIHILKGNHDYIDPDLPFFSFLRWMYEDVHYIQDTILDRRDFLFLPHTRHPEIDWRDDVVIEQMKAAKFIFCHQTFTGGVSQDGYPMEGSSYENLIKPHTDALVFSGDLHKQQVIGDKVHYVGSPYPTTFQRTKHQGRFVLLDAESGTFEDIKVDMGQRFSIVADINDEHGLHKLMEDNHVGEDDILKITVTSDDKSVHKWFDYKKALLEDASREGIDVASIELRLSTSSTEEIVERQQERHKAPVEQLDEYCSAKEVPPEVAQVGKDNLEKALEV